MECVDEVFSAAGIDAMWDRDLIAGLPFNDQIKSYIEHAHVFAPVISEASARSVWVHAEIGYALALRIPVLPICFGCDPSGMIQEVHAVTIHADPTDRASFLTETTAKLTRGQIEHLLEEAGGQSAFFECPEDNARRAGLLAHYARRVRSIGRYGRIRQKASLTSFHLPDRPAADRIWELYYQRSVRDNRYLYDNLLAERRSLEEHAQVEGCRLIIDAADLYESMYGRHGPQSAPARVRGLLDFLEEGSVAHVEVAVNTDPDRKGSITIVGDWFSSEAISSKESANLREAIFTRNAAAIRRQIREFDVEFDRLLKVRNWSVENSRKEAIQYLRGHLDALPAGSRP